MDELESTFILNQELGELRRLPYSHFEKMIDERNVITREIQGKAGVVYQLEIEAFFDDQQKRNIRVMANIDDGGIRAFFPKSNDFILSPEGNFIGE